MTGGLDSPESSEAGSVQRREEVEGKGSFGWGLEARVCRKSCPAKGIVGMLVVLGCTAGLACSHHTALRTVADGGDGAGGGEVGVSSGDGEVAKAYGGVVIASLTQSGGSRGYSVFADFPVAPNLELNRIGSSCSCIHIALVRPIPPLPDAGTVTISSVPGGILLARLVPVADQYQGSWDLGFLRAGAYTSADSQAWNSGDVLSVAATGGEVHAFSGTIQVPALFSEVVPDLSSAALVIDRAQDFSVTWTAEGRANESVLLILQQLAPSIPTSTCYCGVPDAAGALMIDAATLAGFSTEAGGTVRLERLIVSEASSDNATITLVGEVAETATVTFQ